jgi:arylsulfatase A-like enzyme
VRDIIVTRDFLRVSVLGAAILFGVLLAGGASLLSLGSGEVSAQTAQRPNIVFVLTDDQMPGTEDEMPALQSNLVQQGVKFDNMTSTFPLCCPGRATLLRGQYVHNTQIYGNSLPAGGWEKFKDRGLHRSTFATWLDGVGYQTGLFGKFMNNYKERGAPPPGWDRWYAWNGVDMGWTSVNDQGTERPLERQEADSLVAKEALGFLSTRLDNPAPVLAYVNFGAMHEPYFHAGVDDDKFAGVNVPRTPAFNEKDVSDKPSYVSDLPPLSQEKISQLDQDYRNGLHSLMRVDRFIADAVGLLRRSGELSNTYFVFYTDNGAHFGQHRFEHGKLQPYEEDVNFPLIVRGPGIPHGEVSTELVGNHDVAPTIADMAGADAPAFVDGRSFLGLAQNPTAAPWTRTAILGERENNGTPPNRWDMLRMKDDEGVKVYTRHQTGRVDKEYYDLARDPNQLHNALGPADKTYPAPDPATRAHYEKRLDDLYRCGSGPRAPDAPERSMPCRQAEDAPLLPSGPTP